MRFEPGYLLGVALQTVPEPRKIARELFAIDLPRKTLWTALSLVVVLAVMLSVIANILAPIDAKTYGPILSSPMTLGAMEAVFMLLLVWGLYVIGRLFGGHGTLEQAIITVTWMEGILLLLQLLTFVFVFFAPVLAGLMGIGSVFIFFWVLSHFTAESHGFRSTGLVFTTILLTLVLAVFLLSMILVMVGFDPGPFVVDPAQ